MNCLPQEGAGSFVTPVVAAVQRMGPNRRMPLCSPHVPPTSSNERRDHRDYDPSPRCSQCGRGSRTPALAAMASGADFPCRAAASDRRRTLGYNRLADQGLSEDKVVGPNLVRPAGPSRFTAGSTTCSAAPHHAPVSICSTCRFHVNLPILAFRVNFRRRCHLFDMFRQNPLAHFQQARQGLGRGWRSNFS